MSPGNGPACMHFATFPLSARPLWGAIWGMHLWCRECQGVSDLTWQMSLDSVDNGVEPEVRNRWKPHGTRLSARCLNDRQMRPYGQKGWVGALLGAFWDRFFRDWRPDRSLRCRACHLALNVQDRQVNSSPDRGDKAVESHVRNRWKPHGTRLPARCLKNGHARIWRQETHGKVPQQAAHFHAFLHPDRA